jgi:glutathione S-transferase
MADLILHHYPQSPFAEKIRRLLAWKKLPWTSVIIPMVMPKPDVVAFTGGYRRTPLLQVGADIYCDTALIGEVLDHRSPQPPLFPPPVRGLARIVAQWADSSLFWASMGHSLSPAGAAQMLATAPPELARQFGPDRAQMREGMTRLRATDAASAYRSYLRRIASMLDGQPYLLGAQPCAADFAAYHALWFTRVQTPGMAGILQATPGVLDWLDRMAAPADTATGEISSAAALEVARTATPAAVDDLAFQDDHGIALGTRVLIAAESFGTEPSEGELVAATRTHYTIRRSDARSGTVHVHFPRVGYSLRAAPAA